MANSLKYGRTLAIRKDTTTHNPHFPHAITSPVVLPSVYPIPDPRPTTCLQQILPWSSLFYLPHFVTHIHPQHLTQLSVLTRSFCLHSLVCTHPCHLTQLPRVFHFQPHPQHNATLFSTLAYALLLPTRTYLFFFIQLIVLDSLSPEDGGSKIHNVSTYLHHHSITFQKK
jgi:hypothetical protein